MKRIFRAALSLALALLLLTGYALSPIAANVAQAGSKKPSVYIVTTWNNRRYNAGKSFASSDNGQKYTASLAIYYANNVTYLRARLVNSKNKVVAGQDQGWSVNGSGSVSWSCYIPTWSPTGTYKLVIDAYQGNKATSFSFTWKVTQYVHTARPGTVMQQKFDYLKSMLPQGKYWNHGTKGVQTIRLNNGVTTTISSGPCNSWSHRGKNYLSDSATCNHNSEGYQCYGFAMMLAQYVWGSMPTNKSKVYDTNEVYTLQPGDVVRFLNDKHSIFILKVEKNKIYYADCNWANTCRIRWNGTISVNELRKTFSYAWKYDKR